MTWLLICSLALIVFINRYVFLEPKVVIRLPVFFQQMLQYSAPCLLVAICAPIIFFQGDQLRVNIFDPYILSATLCVILALLNQRILLNLSLALVCFYTLNYFL